LSHLAALQQFEALLAIPGIVPEMVTVSDLCVLHSVHHSYFVTFAVLLRVI